MLGLKLLQAVAFTRRGEVSGRDGRRRPELTQLIGEIVGGARADAAAVWELSARTLGRRRGQSERNLRCHFHARAGQRAIAAFGSSTSSLSRPPRRPLSAPSSGWSGRARDAGFSRRSLAAAGGRISAR